MIHIQKNTLTSFFFTVVLVSSLVACFSTKTMPVKNSEEGQPATILEAQFSVKKRMLSSSGSFEYVDILPDYQVGEKVIIAPGTPITLKEMKRFILFMAKNGKRAICPMHSNYGLFESPAEKRTEVLYKLLNKFKGAHLLAHSYGAIDTIRMVNNWIENDMPINAIKSIILINAAGLKKDSRFYSHYNNFNNYLDSGRTQEEILFLKEWKKVCDNYPLIMAFKETWDIIHMDLLKSIQKLKQMGIHIVIIQTNDTLLYPDGINGTEVIADFKIEDGGDHNGLLINPQKYCGAEILKSLERTE